MAGDWIKMRVDLNDDPAVIAIAAETDLDEYEVVGRLHKFWSWADRHSVDGNALRVTRAWINRYLQCDNFAEALFQAGWLEGDDGMLDLPHFDRHNGETAKKRAQTNKRVAEHRERQRDGNAGSVTEDVTDSVTESVTREEKRREEKKEVKASRPRKTGLPIDFGVSDRVRAWAAEKGHSNLEGHLESFRAKATAKGYEYVDWDSAFMEAIRENWAKLALPVVRINGRRDRDENGIRFDN